MHIYHIFVVRNMTNSWLYCKTKRDTTHSNESCLGDTRHARAISRDMTLLQGKCAKCLHVYTYWCICVHIYNYETSLCSEATRVHVSLCIVCHMSICIYILFHMCAHLLTRNMTLLQGNIYA